MMRRSLEATDRVPRGAALIIVVVVVAMLSLAGLSFVATMQSHRKAFRVESERLQLTCAVASGIEAMKAFCELSSRDQREAGGVWDNVGVFREIPLTNVTTGRFRPCFSVFSPRRDNGESAEVRFGTENESARLNLGAVVQWEQKEPGAGRRALMSLPGMTESVADSILDWVDSDATPRQFGAEADYYEGLGVPYAPRNGVPQCLEELLLVRGVTRQMLYGRGAGSPGERPWASLLTVASAERNESFDGRPRIDLNDEDLSELQRRLAGVFDRKWVDFIVAYRQFGPYNGDRPSTPGASITVDPSKPPRFRLASPLDLIGARVLVPATSSGDDKTGAILASPLRPEPAALREDLAKLLDLATTDPLPVVSGRVNINLAPRPVLMAIPGMDSALAERIVAARNMKASADDPTRRQPVWLLTEGIADLPRMKALLPYVTGGGDIHRARVMGFYEEADRSIVAEVVIDATTRPARQIYYKETPILAPEPDTDGVKSAR